MTELIRFDNVTLGYRRRVVLEDLNFSIRDGEFFGIVGANGSGKTTILRALLGILKPHRGQIFGYLPAGEALPEGGRVVLNEMPGALRFGYVPQRGFLDEMYPLTGRDIVLMGRAAVCGPLQWPGVRDRQVVQEALEHVGAGELADRPFRALSGGQKQRVLIARALASESRLLVLDEPTDGMDLEGQRSILDLIFRLRAETGITVVYVTHRLNELTNVVQRLLLLHAGQVRVGTADEVLTSEVLSAVYGVPVRVELIEGRRVILA
ncbi:MAG: putative ABC transporter ATP-binding protein [Verrucomicrobiae bacterium]|nr:putative ABC transporter ATP-binding protein [Verrucomicrobiae bacterium]